MITCPQWRTPPVPLPPHPLLLPHRTLSNHRCARHRIGSCRCRASSDPSCAPYCRLTSPEPCWHWTSSPTTVSCHQQQLVSMYLGHTSGWERGHRPHSTAFTSCLSPAHTNNVCLSCSAVRQHAQDSPRQGQPHPHQAHHRRYHSNYDTMCGCEQGLYTGM